LIGVPQWKIKILNAFDPEKPGRDEIGAQISFGEEIPSGKQVIEKEKRRKKKD